ncbi:MAG: hypothetical protein ACRC2T_09485 [Thermoguttaceae bacterium]
MFSNVGNLKTITAKHEKLAKIADQREAEHFTRSAPPIPGSGVKFDV